MAQDIYLYINVPFCLKRCNYCYCTLVISDEDLLSRMDNSELYVEAVLKEISSFSGMNKRCLGISFGGGTPSVLEVTQIERLLNAAMKNCASIKEQAQISMEIFPGTKNLDELKSLRSMGFNRASVGAQSFDDEELRLLGRLHNKKAIYKTYDDLCAAGFDNINIDLMFGLPVGNLPRWMKTVDEALGLQPTHLTAYYWFITLGSNFFHRVKEGSLELPSREEYIEQYRYVINAAKEHGLRLYFDFNFSRGPEYEYAIERDIFRFFPVRGFGPGAWSQEGRIKILNCTSLQTYLMDPSSKQQKVSNVDAYMSRVLMYPQGMVFNEFEQLFKQKWATKLMGEKLRKSFISWIDKGFIDIDDTGIRFKEKTWEQSAIYLADFQTKAWYCPEKELPLLASR
jgi:oxygen-independent coproporphyrinogen-3 oxidase